MESKVIDSLWFNFQPVPGASFKLNDTVRITFGENRGEQGSVIALLALEPEPLYSVELSSGSDVSVVESRLEAVL